MNVRKPEWSVFLEFADAGASDDQIDVLFVALARHGPAVTGGGAWPLGIRLSLRAQDGIAAIHRADAIVREAMADAGIDPRATLVRHEAHSMRALIAENRGVGTDALVGLSAIAERHRFSRQRAHELSRHPTFPPPVARVGRSPVWYLADVERWMAVPRPPGRPRKSIRR